MIQTNKQLRKRMVFFNKLKEKGSSELLMVMQDSDNRIELRKYALKFLFFFKKEGFVYTWSEIGYITCQNYYESDRKEDAIKMFKDEKKELFF